MKGRTGLENTNKHVADCVHPRQRATGVLLALLICLQAVEELQDNGREL